MLYGSSTCYSFCCQPYAGRAASSNWPCPLLDISAASQLLLCFARLDTGITPAQIFTDGGILYITFQGCLIMQAAK